MKVYNKQLVNDVLYQPIVNGARTVVGFECLARIVGVNSLDSFMSELNPDFIDHLLIDLLRVVNVHIGFSRFRDAVAGKRLYVNCEKSNLANPAIIDILIEFAQFLKSYSVTMVVEITERDLQPSRSCSAYIEGVRRLSLANIPVALDDFLIDESDRTELESALCKIVKVEVDALPLSHEALHGKADPVQIRFIAESLEQFARRYDVELLLERVDTFYCFDTLSLLPFQYFQGFQFGIPSPCSTYCFSPSISYTSISAKLPSAKHS